MTAALPPTPYAPCTPQAGYGDQEPWQPNPEYSVEAEVLNVSVPLATNAWIYTGLQLQSGQGLSVQAWGEGNFAQGSASYAYPEGAYGSGGPRHFGYDPELATQSYSSTNACSNVTANALVLALSPAPGTPPATPPAGGTNPPPAISTGLYPQRSAFFTAAQVLAATGQTYGAVWALFNDSTYNHNACAFTVNLRALSPVTAVGGVDFNVESLSLEGASGCSALLTLTLLDASGNPVNAPSGGQQFFLTDSTGFFNPVPPVFIPAGSSTVSITYTHPQTGTYPVVVTPGSGVLDGEAAQEILVTVGCSAADPNACLCAITRPHMRDAVRRKAGIEPPIDAGFGQAGEEPPGPRWPSNALLNQVLADAIRDINQRCKLHTTLNLSVVVPPAPSGSQGVQWVNLAGLIGCPTQAALNTVRRAVWYDGSATSPALLVPTSLHESDRIDALIDLLNPSQPQLFMIAGYQLGLIPGSANGGTLVLTAGTAITQFCSDSDVIDQIPTDYEKLIEDGATALLAATNITKARSMFDVQFYQGEYERGILQLISGLNTLNESFTPGMGVLSYRLPPIRGSQAFIRRSGR